jgi:hypothetical protein
LRTKKWLSLRQSERATNTVDQVVLAPDERKSLVEKLYNEALSSGKITPAVIAANTNLASIAAQIPPRSSTPIKAGAWMSQPQKISAAKPVVIFAQGKLAPPADPMEALLTALIPIGDGDLATLAAKRAKAAQAYLVETGKVDAARLFLSESQTGGVRSDGSRAYLQFR